MAVGISKIPAAEDFSVISKMKGVCPDGQTPYLFHKTAKGIKRI